MRFGLQVYGLSFRFKVWRFRTPGFVAQDFKLALGRVVRVPYSPHIRGFLFSVVLLEPL